MADASVTRFAERLSATIGGADATMVLDGLKRVSAHLAARPARVTFGGYFSSGKSSLINMLTGTGLLPTDELPETGVPCLIRPGDANRVLVRTGDGVTEVPFTTEAIAEYVSLVGVTGAYRDSIHAVRDVRVILKDRPIPADATWVDSPGINDKGKIDELAAELARTGDILVWVVSSHHTFSLTEQSFLAAHIAAIGAAAGRALGGSSSAAKRREAIRDQLTQAGNAASADMLGAEDDVVVLAVRECTQHGAVPTAAPVDQSRLRALRAARQSLEETMLKRLADSLARAQAQAETGG